MPHAFRSTQDCTAPLVLWQLGIERNVKIWWQRIKTELTEPNCSCKSWEDFSFRLFWEGLNWSLNNLIKMLLFSLILLFLFHISSRVSARQKFQCICQNSFRLHSHSKWDTYNPKSNYQYKIKRGKCLIINGQQILRDFLYLVSGNSEPPSVSHKTRSEKDRNWRSPLSVPLGIFVWGPSGCISEVQKASAWQCFLLSSPQTNEFPWSLDYLWGWG